ncbi:MAG: multidrug ABC transporter, partial [Parasporobacterium sp.]|nr:multidrug ABC transporter [Parasporobacterium sp.]
MTDKSILLYSGFVFFGTFISAVSQVMLKKAADKEYDSPIKEYLNPLVIGAYTIFVVATFMSILAYKVVPLS